MLLAMAASNNISPDDIAGVAVAAGSVAGGLGSAIFSRQVFRRQRRRMINQLAEAAMIARPVPQDHNAEQTAHTQQMLFELEFSRMQSLFRRSDIAFYTSLCLIVAAAALFLWGGALVILGVTAAHIISVVSSAIPAAISALSKRTSDNAERQADKVFDRLVEKIDRMDAEFRVDSGKETLTAPKNKRALPRNG